MSDTVLAVRDLAVAFGATRAVDGVSFELHRGRTLALVGESGAGKTLTGLALLGLTAPGRIAAGSIRFGEQELVGAPERTLRALRGNRIAMVFQEPATALNPVLDIGTQVAEPLEVHQGLSRRAARARAVELLAEVGLPAPEERLRSYPFELSGGQRQRVMIAMALACAPDVLIADEPTTALDVTIQAQILDVLARLERERAMALLFITHDLALVAELADEVAVMRAGKIVEHAAVPAFLAGTAHAYSQRLLAAARRMSGVA